MSFRPPPAQSGSGAILPWATGTAYAQGQTVTNSGHTYTANDGHTAGATFAGDLASHWTLLPLTAADVAAVASTEKGAANGVAQLDSGSKLPVAQLPTSVMEFKGVWNASTNTPTLADASGSVGDVYRVSVGATRNLGSGAQTFDVGDLVILNASQVWEKSDTTDAVQSVAGKTGAVTLTAADVGFVPNGSIAATTVQAAIQEVRDEAGGVSLPSLSGHHGGELLAVAPDAAATEWTMPARDPLGVWRRGRIWDTDFSNAEYDTGLFDVTNLQHGTDPLDSKPSAFLSSGTEGTYGTFLTKDRIADWKIHLQFRAKELGVFDITNVFLGLIGCRLGDNNMWRVQRTWNTGAVQGHSIAAGSDLSTGTAGTADAADTTTDQIMVAEKRGDTLLLKWWFVGSAQPDWLYKARLRPAYGTIGQVGGGADTDNVDLGVCGFQVRYGIYAKHLTVTELIRDDATNLLYNADLELRDGSDLPFSWGKNAADGGGNSLSVVTTEADPWGVVRPLLRATQATDDGVGRLWLQQVFAAGMYPNVWLPSRSRPHPMMGDAPFAIEYSVWTKFLTTVANSGALAVLLDFYQYGSNSEVLNLGQPGYFPRLGPGGPAGAGTGAAGGWILNRGRIELSNPQRLVKLDINFGFHDPTSTGDVIFCDPRIRPLYR